MKPWHALALVVLPLVVGPLRADLVAYSFTAQVTLFDDNGHRVPGIHVGSKFKGTVQFDNSAAGIPAPGALGGMTYPNANALLDFVIHGIPLGTGSLPVNVSLLTVPGPPGSPADVYTFGMHAFNSTPTSYLDVGFGMTKQLGPGATPNYSLKNLHLDFNTFDSGYLFYNFNAGGGPPTIGAPPQLLIEAQILSIKADTKPAKAPEPGGLTLLGLGGVGCAWRLWRRRRAGRLR
jgi:hypothetical protein